MEAIETKVMEVKFIDGPAVVAKVERLNYGLVRLHGLTANEAFSLAFDGNGFNATRSGNDSNRNYYIDAYICNFEYFELLSDEASLGIKHGEREASYC